jgi:large subunit ribosomal protein L35Ae
MQLKILGIRRSRHSVKFTHYLLESEKKDSEKLIGKSVEWKSSSGRKIKGKIASPHGARGNLRVIMEKGLPGQAVSTFVEVK